MRAPHAITIRDFSPVLDDTGHTTPFFWFELETGDGRVFHQAVAWLRVHVVRKFFRQLKSLTELADDVASGLYDPGDGRNRIHGLYGLGNIPDLGLVQMYGVRGFGRSREEALARARRDAYALTGVLEGKFRQIGLAPLTVEEASAFYDHLKRCRHLAAVVGQPVRRIAAGHASMDAWTRLSAQEQQEQMEVLATACADIPFQAMVWVDPLTFEEISRLLIITTQELSKWASEVKGNKSASVTAMIPALFRPTYEWFVAQDRTFGLTRGAQMSDGRVHHDITHLRHEASAGDHRLDQHDRLTYEGTEQGWRSERVHEEQTGVQDTALQEHIVEQMDQHSHLQWASHVDRTVAFEGRELTDVEQRARQLGQVQESQELHEHETAHTTIDRESLLREGIDERVSGQLNEDIHIGYGYGEHYSFSRDAMMDTGSATNFRAQQARNYWDLRVARGDHRWDGEQTEDWTRAGERHEQGDYIDHEITAREGGDFNFGIRVYGFGGAETQEAYDERSRNQFDHSVGFDGSEHIEVQRDGYLNTFDRVNTQGRDGYQVGGHTEVDQIISSHQEGRGMFSGSGWRAMDIQTNFELTQHVDRVTRARYLAEESMERFADTERDIQREWTQEAQDFVLGKRAYAGVLSASLDESGTTASRLRQLSEIDRATRAHEEWGQVVDARRQIGYAQGQEGEQTTDLARAARSRDVVDAMGREVSTGPTLSQAQVAGLLSGTTRASRALSGFGSAGTPYLVAGIHRSFQTYDAQKDLIVTVLKKQQERLRVSLDTGLFLTHFWVGAYNDEDLRRVTAGAITALREEEVVSPLHIRFPRDEEQARDWYTHLLALHPCDEEEAVGPWNLEVSGETLTSDELGAIIHPLRVDGHGGISTGVSAIPPDIRTPGPTKGEISWGFVISPTTGKFTGQQFRTLAKQLMHLVCVGKTGSGKSNAFQYLTAQVMNNVRVDDEGNRIPVPVRDVPGWGVLPRTVGDHGHPYFGVTVFDPHGDWRRVALMVDPREVDFYSLYSDFRPLYFNPLRIPSPYIRPDVWAETVAQRWALAYSTGSAGFNLLRTAIMLLYREAGVYVPGTRQIDIDASRHVRLTDLAQKLADMREGKVKDRSTRAISVLVLDNILDKLWVYTAEAGGLAYELFSTHEGVTIETWMPERRLVILEGGFQDDNMRRFIMQLLASACFLHAQGRFKAHGHRAGTFPPHILVFEEAHAVMEREDQVDGEVAKAVAGGKSIWSRLGQEGRKFGLYLWVNAQRLTGLPEGIRDSARFLTVLNIGNEKDIREAVIKMARIPTGITVDVTWMKFFQTLPFGWAAMRISPARSEEEAAPFLLAFPNLDDLPAPDDVQLDFVLRTAHLWGRVTAVPPREAKEEAGREEEQEKAERPGERVRYVYA
jgi:hypothetical protein